MNRATLRAVCRLRLPLILIGVVFHGCMYFVLPVLTFSITMILLNLAFLDPDEFHRGLDRLLASPET